MNEGLELEKTMVSHRQYASSIRLRHRRAASYFTHPTLSAESFSHAGDCGDLLSALPALRVASAPFGGGQLNVFPADWTRQRMSPEVAASLASLLEIQPYIKRIEYTKSRTGVALDAWRRRQWPPGYSLADRALDLVGASHSHRNTSWLSVEPHPVARVVFGRSFRYRNERFPWKEVVAKYGKEAVFVGFKEEHEDFVASWGYVPWLATPDYFGLARVIAGCELTVVNQTSSFWIGLGLGCRIFLEEDPRHDWRNCHHDVAWVSYSPLDMNTMPAMIGIAENNGATKR